MSTLIEPWPRPAFRPTGRPASTMFVAFAERDVLSGLDLKVGAPPSAPLAALDLRQHRYSDDPEWFDGWRSGPLRQVATRELPDPERLDAATWCYSIRLIVDDPSDLTHLQLGWAVAGLLAEAGAFAVLDVYTHTWHPGDEVAGLDAHRPFVVQRDVGLVAETDSRPGFGHPVHTRGMIKFGRPDLIAGVPSERIEQTAMILNHLARMLAEGHAFEIGQLFRVDGERTLQVTPYEGDPDVGLIGDGLLLIDI
ncbi:hypothetical protein KZ829_33620 [Actinoplanes hulinensis]|uniref:DUF4261 domain-containing protein n=1 Tax=Actinoplanes hulinensis TaxID=1144547 RepID=A0ABS7BCM2_9ACTN|nr:hypothetical protein [Actinoplanes hulinensis]MBW6438678.1 hypothetical protein [Actinoplanes hulinensis]